MECHPISVKSGSHDLVVTTIVGVHSFSNQLTIQNGGVVSSDLGYIGWGSFSRNNAVLVSGIGSVWNNSSNLYVGYSGSSNQLTIQSGGVVSNAAGYIGYGADSFGNSVLISGGGSLWTNPASIYYVGYEGSSNSLTLSNGATLFASNLWIGVMASARGNAVIVTDNGSRLETPDLYVGNTSSWSTVRILNGGVVSNINGYIGYTAVSSNNSVLVSGAGSVWTNPASIYYVGYEGSGNSLILSNGATLFASNLWIGVTANARGNAVIVTDSGSRLETPDLYVGNTSSWSTVRILNGGVANNVNGYIGDTAVSSNNSVLVSGAGSVWNNSDILAVGYGGSFNSLVITNGGVVLNSTTGGVGILPGANYNTALISGSGSVWSNGSGFAMGLFGAGNRLTMNKGGRLVTGDGVVGENSGADSNVVVVADPGSVWSNRGDLNIGVATVGNRLVITNGGVVRTLGNFRLGTNASFLNSATIYICGDFENMATNQSLNDFSGTNIFNGSSGGGVGNLQSLEVASAFAKPGLGTATNFYFGTVSIGDAASGSNAWVRLVDNQANQTGGGVETFGASNVIVALAQSILDLNNRTSFIQNLSNFGTILQTNTGSPGLARTKRFTWTC